MTDAPSPYLQVRALTVRFDTEDGVLNAVGGVTFGVDRGRTLGIVGESGSGKTVTALAMLGLHDARRTHITGEIRIGGRDIVGLGDEEIRQLRGRDVAMIFQDPLSALHPFYPVGRQIAEAYRVHHRSARAAQARRQAIDLLGRVGIPQAATRVDQYPHEFSGGMRQRAMIAMALANDPDLLIADEPTTALDVTVQAQILDLLVDLQQEFSSAIVLITHDLGVVSRVAHDVLVMYAGRGVELGSVEQVLRRPQHPYTWGLLASVPSLHSAAGTTLLPIPGNPPSLIDLPTGCAFRPRCRYSGHTGGRSFGEAPVLRSTGEPGHLLACHLPGEDRQQLYERDIATPGVTS